jgi:curved DNA-binding protein
MAEDYYDTLGVKRDASQADIQKAYRDMARKYHPDLHPDDKSAKKKFQQVQKAFEVLNDASKREMYDRYGSSFEQMGAGGPQGNPWAGGQPGGPGGASYEDIDLSQLFGERFGEESAGGFGDIFNQFRRAGKRGKRAAEPSRGNDLETEMTIPFNTAITGGEVQLSVQRHDGRVETISVKIPPGVEDGKKVRVRGQGEPGPGGGPAGDIIIKIRVATHPYFTRRDRHLQLRLPITLAEAALGAKVDVPTPWGAVALRIPASTSSGKKFRVKGHGIRTKGGEDGDLYAETQIVLPSKLDEESLELIRQLDAHQPTPNPRSELRW